MRRREFIVGLAGAAAWPSAPSAQQQPLSLVGVLHSATPEGTRPDMAALLSGLAEAGYEDGRNITIRWQWARNRYSELPALAADLVRSGVSVIFVTGGAEPALAAKAQTSSIPIVFVHGSDPVSVGLVPNLNRPGGNVTGVVFYNSVLPAKQLEVMHELLPKANAFGALVNMASATADERIPALEDAARRLNVKLDFAGVRSEGEFEAAFARFAELRAGGVLIVPDPMFRSHLDKLTALSRRHSLPTISNSPEAAKAGLVMSYGNNRREVFRQAGIYTGKILSGAKAADLPVLRSDSFELVINAKAARDLGIEVPVPLLARADEVIE